MTNAEILSKALGEWGFNIAKSFLPKFRIPQGGKLGGFMQIIGMDPAKYNIWNELGFLAEPIIQSVVSPLIARYAASVPDEQLKELAYKFADAFIAQAKQKGSVNLFGMELGENAFVGLKDIMDAYFKEE